MKKLPWTPVEMKKTFTQNEVVRFFMLLMFILQIQTYNMGRNFRGVTPYFILVVQ
jgi:hypothetical protein